MNNIRQQENQFMPFIYQKLKRSLFNLPDNYFIIKQSSDEEDTKLSFDMKFTSDIQISVRLRKYKYISYKDITIRSRSKKGGLTEITKLSNGMGQIFFYGWLDEKEENIIQWVLVDIDKIRDKLHTHYSGDFPNNDGSRLKTYSFDFLKEYGAIINAGK